MNAPADELELRARIVRVAQALDQAGFCPSKSGNVSCRHRDGLLRLVGEGVDAVIARKGVFREP